MGSLQARIVHRGTGARAPQSLKWGEALEMGAPTIDCLLMLLHVRLIKRLLLKAD